MFFQRTHQKIRKVNPSDTINGIYRFIESHQKQGCAIDFINNNDRFYMSAFSRHKCMNYIRNDGFIDFDIYWDSYEKMWINGEYYSYNIKIAVLHELGFCESYKIVHEYFTSMFIIQ